MINDRDILLRYLEGSLADPEVRRLEKRLEDDSTLREELTHLQLIGEALSGSRAEGFGAFFAERVIKRLRPAVVDRALPLYHALKWLFVRTAFVGLVLVIFLGVLNVTGYQGLDVASSWLEAAFGLPSTTVEDAFTYGFI